MLARRGTQLVSTLLYHALTTGAGSRTLGEEYCDLLQVTGVHHCFRGNEHTVILVDPVSNLPFRLPQ